MFREEEIIVCSLAIIVFVIAPFLRGCA